MCYDTRGENLIAWKQEGLGSLLDKIVENEIKCSAGIMHVQTEINSP